MREKRLAKDRAWELDFLRGIAIIMMLFMHMSWDVRFEFGVDVFRYLHAPWFWSFVHPIIVVLFVGVSGICSTFSRNNVKRGLKLLAATVGMYTATFVIYKVTGIECLILFNVLAVLTCGIFLYALISLIEKKTEVNPNLVNVIMGLLGLYIVIVGCDIHYMDDTTESLTKSARQRFWRTPTAFPFCPDEVSENGLQIYLNNLKVGEVFSKNDKYDPYYVVDKGMGKRGKTLVVLSTNRKDEFLSWAISTITIENGKYVHENTEAKLDKELCEKYFKYLIGQGELSEDDEIMLDAMA